MRYKFFKAPWCKPCSPVLEQVARITQEDQLEILNVAEETGRREAVRFHVLSLPALIVLEGETPLRMMAGSMIPTQLQAFLLENAAGERTLRV